MSWRDQFKERVTEITKDTLTGKEDMTDEEVMFFMCAIKVAVSAKTKMYALKIADRIIVMPGTSLDDIWIYVLDERGGIRRSSIDEAEKKIERLIPNMPFIPTERCESCGAFFGGGDPVFSLVQKDRVRTYCIGHIRFALKYSGKASGSVAYSFHAADEIDRHDPVVIEKVIINVPRTLEMMKHLLDDVVVRAKKLSRRGRLSERWVEDFQWMLDAQRATLRVLKFAALRIAELRMAALKTEMEIDGVDAPG